MNIDLKDQKSLEAYEAELIKQIFEPPKLDIKTRKNSKNLVQPSSKKPISTQRADNATVLKPALSNQVLDGDNVNQNEPRQKLKGQRGDKR